MSLIDRRNAAAEELLKLTEAAETLVTREGFDPDQAQWTDLQNELNVKRGEVERYDALMDTAHRATARDLPTRPGEDWATSLIRAAAAGQPSRAAEVPVFDRAYGVLTTATPAFKADTVTVRPASPEFVVLTPTLEACTRIQISGSNYRYITMPVPVAAATVAENAKKGNVEFASAEVTGSLIKSAHILDVTQEMLEDMPAARQILSQWLIEGVVRKVESDAAAAITGGSGYLTASTEAGGTVAEGIRLAVATLQANGLSANAAMLNPADWAKLDYQIFGTAGSNSQTVVQSAPWGVNLIASPTVAAGTVFVGDFKAAVAHLERSTVQVDITDSGMSVETSPRDRFTHNLYGFRAEARHKTIVQQPKAIVKTTITPAA